MHVSHDASPYENVLDRGLDVKPDNQRSALPVRPPENSRRCLETEGVGRWTHQMRILQLFNHLYVIELDIQELVHRL